MNTTQAAMATYLNQEISAAHELTDILQEEQNQLLLSNIDELEPLIAKKASLVAQLGQYTRDRHNFLKDAGYEPTQAGMTSWISNCLNEQDAIQISSYWNELIGLSKSAKEINRLNGLLISSHMKRNQQTLAILHGQNEENTGMYGPDGQRNRMNPVPVRGIIAG